MINFSISGKFKITKLAKLQTLTKQNQILWLFTIFWFLNADYRVLCEKSPGEKIKNCVATTHHIILGVARGAHSPQVPAAGDQISAHPRA
jgi:hypothetical protein